MSFVFAVIFSKRVVKLFVNATETLIANALVKSQFENGIKANLTMTAFTALPGRKMTFHGTLGEVEMDEENDYIRLSRYGHGTRFFSIRELLKEAMEDTFGHGGGDFGLVNSLYDMLEGKASAETALEASIESHLIGICAEESRLQGGKLIYIHE